MRPPRISVLMAVKNAMPFLPEAIESILSQSFQDVEFIIVDDHSKDETPDYLATLHDRRIRCLQSPHQGQTLALNFGLASAQAPWIARMDGDDVSLPERLAKQWQALERCPEAVLVSADYYFCDQALNVQATIRLNAEDPGFLHYFQTRQNPFCHPVMMFSKPAAQRLGGYPERLRTAQDYGLWRALLAEGKFVHVAEPLLKYRLVPSSVSIAQYAQQRRDSQRVVAVVDVPKASTAALNAKQVQGMYAYRLGFAAWLDGRRYACIAHMWRAIRCGTRAPKALAAICLSILPHPVYMRISGYHHVYR